MYDMGALSLARQMELAALSLGNFDIAKGKIPLAVKTPTRELLKTWALAVDYG